MTLSSTDPIYSGRVDALVEAIRIAGADGAIIAGPADVAALSGIWIETAAVMPIRAPWLFVGADGSVVLVVQHHEAELARRRCQLDVAGVLQYAGPGDRQDLVVGWTTHANHRRIAADVTDLSAADARALGTHQIDIVDIAAALESIGRRKSDAEVTMIENAARALSAATEQVCRSGDCVGDTEFGVASKVAGLVFGLDPSWGSVVPITSSGENLAVTHARPGERRLSPGDLCRIGARGQYGPFHAMYVRSAVVDDGGLILDSAELTTLADSHAATIARMRVGAPVSDDGLDPIASEIGRVPIPPAQGMGFRFKESPTLGRSSSDRISPGDTLLVSTILQKTSGVRLYWQQLFAAGADDLRPLGGRPDVEHVRPAIPKT